MDAALASGASSSRMRVYAPDDDLFIEPASDEDVVYGAELMEGNSSSVSSPSRQYIRLTTTLRNATREAGQEIRMRCDAIGTPPIHFTWMKNHAPVEKSPRVRIRNKESASRLFISDLDVLDSGFYQCIAANQVASVNSTAVLRVKNVAEKPGLRSRPSTSAGSSRLPPSEEEEYDDYEAGGMENPLGRLPSDEERELFAVPDSAGGPGFMPVGPSERWLDSLKVRPGQCIPYRGEACRSFLSGRHIKITSESREDMYDIDRNLRAAMMFINNSQTISGECKRISHAVACFHMYKVCDMMHDSRLQHICRDDCEKLTKEVCPSELSLAAEHDLVGDGPKQLFPSCSVLPPQTPSGSSSCLRVLLPEKDQGMDGDSNHRHDHWCYVDSGRHYQGVVSTTENGQPCLEWSRVSSSTARADLLALPELRQARNFCRNPGGRKTRPWCFAAPHGQEEYCRVPRCPADTDMYPGHRDKGRLPSQESGSGVSALWESLPANWQLGLALGGLFGVLLLLLICCVCCCRRGRSGGAGGKGRAAGASSAPPPQPLSSIPQSVVNSVNSTYYRKVRNETSTPLSGAALRGGGVEMASLLGTQRGPQPGYESDPPPLHVLEIGCDSLQLRQMLGEGQFGVIHIGAWSAVPGALPVPVAIKSVRIDSPMANRASLEDEIRRVASVEHVNVLRLLGVTYLEGSRLAAVYEYSVNGDLHDLLKLRAVPASEDSHADQLRIAGDSNQFADIATQIASGMAFLSSLRLVHRDLAARNVLVAEQRTIKIADFAVMRICYDEDYYKPPHRAWMPIRWMSPEAIEHGLFSEKSDVWAFGVTLWEIFSYGKRPYEGLPDQEVLRLVTSRQLLPECLPLFPSSMYSLMMGCWHSKPEMRPPFEELHSSLQAWSAASPAHSSLLLHGGPPPPRASSSSHSGSSNGGRLTASRVPRTQQTGYGSRPGGQAGPGQRLRPDDSSPLMRGRRAGGYDEYSGDDSD